MIEYGSYAYWDAQLAAQLYRKDEDMEDLCQTVFTTDVPGTPEPKVYTNGIQMFTASEWEDYIEEVLN